MKVEELRVGNWVLFDGHKARIASVHINGSVSLYGKTTKDIIISSISISKIEPIEIQEFILEKFGFSFNKGETEYTINEGCEFVIGNLFDNKKLWFVYNVKIDGSVYFEFIHELQNLFFGLIGRELDLQD